MLNGGKQGCLWPKWEENKLFTLLLAILMVYGIVWLAGQMRNDWKKFQYIGKADVRDSMSVDGEGKVIGVPDVAVVDLGVMTEGKEVLTAQTDNAKKMNNMINKLKGFGVEAKDIQTVNYSISPQYDWNNGKQLLRGYQVSQNLRVKIRDLTKISAVLQTAGEVGVNQISGVTFSIDDPDALRQQAREKAIADANRKAAYLSKATGMRLSKVISVNEYTPDAPYGFNKSYAEGLGGGLVTAPAPQVESGSLEVKINLNVTYEIL